jgi:hypothetical protein
VHNWPDRAVDNWAMIEVKPLFGRELARALRQIAR